MKLIIFDFSNVCYIDEEKPYLKMFSDKNGLDFEKVYDRFVHHIMRAERNEITGIEAWKNLFEEFDIALHPEAEIENMMSLKKEIRSTFEIINKLKGKYKLAYYTNYCKDHFDYMKKMFDLSMFDYGLASYMTGTRKPEPKGFEMIMEYFNVKPEETLFIDDSKKNVEGAKALGINAIHLDDPEKLEEYLLEEGIEIDK